jgi:predicted ATPase/class 3 adenylate cyclase/Tfp pilus assembly protein PilF
MVVMSGIEWSMQRADSAAERLAQRELTQPGAACTIAPHTMPADPAQRVLLLSDIVDSTQWGQRLGEDAAAALWTQHDRLARDLLREWHGREIDKSDGFLLLFDQVADALGFAASYHAKIVLLDPSLSARVGVHMGPVALRENPANDVAQGAKPLEVDGVAKPIAARIMALARPGQTLLSAAACAGLATDAARLASHGHWQLKGVDEPIELFESVQPHAPPEPPVDGDKGWRVVLNDGQWWPASTRPHSLPAERDRFIGRQAALRELALRFERGARLVCLLGPGGTGKTRLAVRYGWIARGEHPGGVWFCDLAMSRDLDGIVHAMAQGLQLTLSSADPVADIGEAIAGRGRCLVIADNFEQITRHGEHTIGRWLERAPQARFLVTTREVLGIAGEDVLALPPLSPQEGAALFIERAERAGGVALNSSHHEQAVAQLVSLLDGLPLAIELAASRARVLSPAQLLPRMAERFKLLTRSQGRRDRQATLLATLDWSWDLLIDAERAALAQLSAFEGGFTIDAVEAVVDLSASAGAPWVLDSVQSLVQKSLVRRTADNRFDLLHTVRDYAAARLVSGALAGGAVAARDAVWRRHAGHYGSLDETSVSAQRCIETGNLVVACRRMVELGDFEAATRVLLPAWAAVKLVGPFSTGVDLADAACRDARAGPGARSTALWVRGSARFLLGDAPGAREDLEAALAAHPDPSAMRCRVTCTLAEVESTFGDPARAGSLFDDALSLARRLGDSGRQCQALNGLGALAAEQSRAADAAAYYEQGLALARAANNQRWVGGLLGNLGNVSHLLGDFDAARRHYEQALACARDIGDRHFEGNSQCNLGLLLLEMGHPDEALPHFESALDLARSLGHVRLTGTVFCNLGLLNEMEGRIDAALELHASAVQAAARHGDRRSEGQFRVYLGRLLARRGRVGEARECLRASVALLQSTDDLTTAMLLCARAETEHLGGDSATAHALLAQARGHYMASKAEPASELGRELARLETLLRETVIRD